MTQVTEVQVVSTYTPVPNWTVSTDLGFTYRDYQDRAERRDEQTDLD